MVWLHAASVGEALVTEPIARRLRATHSPMQIVQTYSSPSLDDWPCPPGIDQADYVPAESRSAVAAVYKALRPSLIVVSRGDLWPEMIAGALERGVPVAVVGAAVRPNSARLRWPVRSLLTPMHRGLAFVGARSPGDAERWLRLGVPSGVVEETGDPRNDHVLERVPCHRVLRPIASWAVAGQTLVAGSTHRQDDTVVLGAFVRVRAERPTARLVVVPHNPTTETVQAIADRAQTLRLTTACWNDAALSENADVVIVTKSGVLADLYALGSIAYVGGGFGPGVHSLAEPAAYGVPIVTGPGAERDATAEPFLRSGGAVAIGRSDPIRDLLERWKAWLEDAAERTAAGLAARRQVQPGGAAASVRALEALLTGPTGPA